MRRRYYGWALANPNERRCDKCGGVLEMQRDSCSCRARVRPAECAAA